MRTFAERPRIAQRSSPAKISHGRAHFKESRDLNAILHLQRTHGNQAVQRLLRADVRDAGEASVTAETARFGHDAPEAHAHVVEEASMPAAGVNTASNTPTRLPSAGSTQEESVRNPPGTSGTTAPAPATPSSEGCGTPRRMVAVKSGTFHGGLTMSTHYPYLSGHGYWVSNTAAGPFDTGSRVGSSIQLYGLVPSPCQPSQFSFEQTFQDTRIIRNGVHGADEGRVIDDFARSGQNQSRAPFRQQFLDTAGAEGLAIAMADPPSETYGPTDNIEWDCTYVTSLVGPTGRVSTTWSTSVRVVNGAVTRNTLS